jgi:hypothetical protein
MFALNPVADVSLKCDTRPVEVPAVLLLTILCAACATPRHAAVAGRSGVIPVIISAGGDDGLTQRLADAVRTGFERSTAFVVTTAGTPSVLKVTIPAHVGWKQIGSRTQVTYQVVFERGGSRGIASRGFCWETDLADCSAQIVKQASRVVALNDR